MFYERTTNILYRLFLKSHMQWFAWLSEPSKALILYEPPVPSTILANPPPLTPWTLWNFISDLTNSLWTVLVTCDGKLREYWPWLMVVLKILSIFVILRLIICILHTIRELGQLVYSFLCTGYWICKSSASIVQIDTRKHAWKNC